MPEQRQIPLDRLTTPIRPEQTAGAAPLTPKDIAGILRRHIWLIIYFTILGFILGGAGWYLMLRYFPKYTAVTYIRVLPPIEKDPTRIGGGQVQKDIQYGYRASMAALIKQQSTLEELVSRDKIQETQWFQKFGKIKAKRIRKSVKNLKKKFGAHAQRDGEFIVVSMTCGDAEESALIVNEMVDLFIASQRVTKKGEVSAKLAGLRNQLDNTQKELLYAEKMLDEVRKTSKFTDLEQHGFQTSLELKLASLETDESQLSQDIGQIQASVKILEEQLRRPVDDQIEHEIERDPTMIMLTQQLAMQEAQLAGSLSKFGENHPVVRRYREMLDEIRAKRQQRKAEIALQTRQANYMNAQNQLTILQENLAALEKMRQETAAKKAELDLARALYERRMTTRDEIKDRLDELKTQISKRTIMHDDPETAKVQRVGLAPVPFEVSSPLWYIYFPAGIILGFMAGVGLSFLIELLNDLVRTPRDVGRYLRTALLAVVPDASEDGQLENIELWHAVRQAPYSILSESYRRLRANIKLSASGHSSSTFLIASGMAGEGKTSTAVNLATAFAAEEKKVLLVDANFWKPMLGKIFPKMEIEDHQQGAEFGLSTVLAGLCGYHEVIRPTGIDGFDVIDSGMLPSNPAELLGSSRMQQLIKQQSQSYDYVIIDGPPVLLVSEVKSLSKFVDGTILVVNAGITRRGAAIRTIGEFREVNTPIFGCVLFAVKAMKGGYFSEQFKSYRKYQEAQLAHSV